MKITSIEIAKLRIPLIRPFITALRKTDHIEDIIVIVKTDTGISGYGSAAATPVITGDSIESIIGAISILANRLIGRELSEFEELLLLIQNSIINNSSAKAALDIAIHDLVAKNLNIALYQFLGGNKRQVNTLTTVSINDIDTMVNDAKLFVDQGFTTLKVKVGLDRLMDFSRLQKIREAVGNQVRIVCDANQGWDSKTAICLINKLVTHDLDIAMVEQPVRSWDILNLKYVRDNSLLPIYADEAVFGLRDALEVITNQAADGINIKLMKSGGIYQARSIYALASSYQLPCMAGCMLESPVGLAAMASFVSGRSNIQYVDLDPISMIKNNPVIGGLTYKSGSLLMSDKPGLGIEGIEGLEIVRHI